LHLIFYYKLPKQIFFSPPAFTSLLFAGYLKKSEPILLTGEGRAERQRPNPLFHPPRQKAEAEKTISSFSNPALRDCSAVPRLAENSFKFLPFFLLLLV
jgi:hypothetical protein